MAKDEVEQDEITVAVPLRRLLTGVPRTRRAPAAIPRVKRFVLRHIDPDWRDAIWDEDKGVHRVWIDDFLNKAIWSRGREHVAGPREWIEPVEGQRPRLAQRTTSRYGSVLKVKALFVEEPRDGGDPRLEVYLYGYGDLEKEEESEEGEDKEKGGEGEEAAGGKADKAAKAHDEDEAGKAEEADGAKDAPAAKAPEAKQAKPAQAPKGGDKKPASTSAAGKSGKGAAPAKSEPKKPAAKPKKEGGD